MTSSTGRYKYTGRWAFRATRRWPRCTSARGMRASSTAPTRCTGWWSPAASSSATDRAMAGASSSAVIDVAAVAGFCDRHGIGAGATRVERLGDGHSNLTYLVERDGVRVVLRRPPPPPLPPSAHDMVRESGIVDALHRAGARVPQVLAVCRDESVIGVPFYVMTLVDGAPIDTQLPAEIADATECARLGADIVDALVEVHAIDIRAAGLDPFGRPDGYLARQVRRFLGLWDVNRTRDLPLVAEVGALLAETAPESGPATVVHGDYRVGNLLAARDAPGRVAAIL